MLVSLLHGCSITPNTVISYSCITIAWILLVYILISLLCRFTGIHALIVLVFVLPESLFLLHDLLLNEYSCIPVTCVFNIVYDHFLYHCVDMKLLLSRHTVYWYLTCETKCHMKTTSSIHGAISRVPHLLFSIIFFSDTRIAYVLLSCTCYMHCYSSWFIEYLTNTIWGWGDLTVD